MQYFHFLASPVIPHTYTYPPYHTHFQILPRNANLETAGGPAGPPPEQDVPLQVWMYRCGCVWFAIMRLAVGVLEACYPRPEAGCTCACSVSTVTPPPHLSASPSPPL